VNKLDIFLAFSRRLGDENLSKIRSRLAYGVLNIRFVTNHGDCILAIVAATFQAICYQRLTFTHFLGGSDLLTEVECAYNVSVSYGRE
jgi:hypothetical protein